MLWTIFVILLVLWLLGVVTSYTLGGFIHILLVVAIAVVLIQLITGRRAVCRGRSVTHTTRSQPRSRSILRTAAISADRSVGGSTSRSETNSTRHRTPGSRTASRPASSSTRLSVSSEAGPGAASRPMTSSGC